MRLGLKIQQQEGQVWGKSLPLKVEVNWYLTKKFDHHRWRITDGSERIGSLPSWANGQK
ncbi:unnamed protein product, partial [Nesidiocoris tenuis]